jgi:serine/threonine-protein kinase
MGDPIIDGRADLYSLGCTAYFLLSGGLVFDAQSSVAYAIAHVQTRPVPISRKTHLPIPAALEAIVMQLLEKDPKDRIQSARDLSRRLRALPEAGGWSLEQAEQWWDANLPVVGIPEPVPGAAEQESRSVPLYA